MAYLPRRRLVLASSGAISSYNPWPGSQLPWDAEEEFSQNGKHDQFISSQGPDFTQELYPCSGTSTTTPQSSQPNRSASLDKQCDSHFSLQQPTEFPLFATMPNRLETCSVRDLPASHVVAINSLCLPLHEYTELHHLLTKGFPCVQAASAKERAMYKLADLRQIMRLHGLSQGSRNKEDALNALQGVQLIHPSIIAACKDETQHKLNDTQQECMRNVIIYQPPSSDLNKQPAMPLTSTEGNLSLVNSQREDEDRSWQQQHTQQQQQNLHQQCFHDTDQCFGTLGSLQSSEPYSNECEFQPAYTALPDTPTGYVYASEQCNSLHSSLDAQKRECNRFCATGDAYNLHYAAEEDHLSASDATQPAMISSDTGAAHSAQDLRQPLCLMQFQQQTPGLITAPNAKLTCCQTAVQQTSSVPQLDKSATGSPVNAFAHKHSHCTALLATQPVPSDEQSARLQPKSAGRNLPLSAQHQAEQLCLKPLPLKTTASTAQPQAASCVDGTVQNAANTCCEGTTLHPIKQPATVRVGQVAACSGRTVSSDWKRTKRDAKECTVDVSHTALAAAQVQPTLRNSSQTDTSPCHDRHASPQVAEQQGEDSTGTHQALHDVSAVTDIATHASSMYAPLQPALTADCSKPVTLPTAIPTSEAVQIYSAQPANAACAATEAESAACHIVAQQAGAAHHSEMLSWLPAQLSQLQQHYRVRPGKTPSDLVGQRVAVVLLEQFEQQDQTGSKDVLSSGLHVGQVMELLGSQHQPDICPEDCTAQHSYYYIRLQPNHSVLVRPGCKRKRRLDLKVDLGCQHRVSSFDQMLQLSQLQLQDAWLLVQPTGILPKSVQLKASQHLAKGLEKHASPAGLTSGRCDKTGASKRRGRGRGLARGETASRAQQRSQKGKVLRTSKPSTKAAPPNDCKSKQAQARPGGTSKLDPGHEQLKGSASTDANASAYYLPAADNATGSVQQHHARGGLSDDSGAVACGHSQAAHNGVLGNAVEVCLSLMKGAVFWAPFGATCWPAKLIKQPSSAAKSSHQTRQSLAALEGSQTALQGPKTALVELFGTGLRVEVSPDGLIPWDQDCAGRCALLHSDMGKEAIQLAVKYQESLTMTQ